MIRFSIIAKVLSFMLVIFAFIVFMSVKSYASITTVTSNCTLSYGDLTGLCQAYPISTDFYGGTIYVQETPITGASCQPVCYDVNQVALVVGIVQNGVLTTGQTLAVFFADPAGTEQPQKFVGYNPDDTEITPTQLSKYLTGGFTLAVLPSPMWTNPTSNIPTAVVTAKICSPGTNCGPPPPPQACTCPDLMSNMSNEVTVFPGDFTGHPLSTTGQDTAMFAAFQPRCPDGTRLSLSQALQICSQYSAFDWVQKFLVTPATYHALNSVNYGPVVPGQTQNVFTDPVLSGYTYDLIDPGYADLSNPFYYNTNNDNGVFSIGGQELTTANPQVCAGSGHTGSDPDTLCFEDSPQLTPIFAGTAFPYQQFYTALVGIKSGGSGNSASTYDTLLPFGWLSNYIANGGGGATITNKSNNPGPVDSPGAGGVTILEINGVLSVTALSSGTSCNGNFDGTFTGDVTISAGQNCTFTPSCEITGNVTINGGSFNLACLVDGNLTENGGSLVLGPGAQIKGNVQISQAGTPTLADALIGGNLQIQGLSEGLAQGTVCGTQVKGNLQVQNNASPIEIGGAGAQSCPGNTVGGNLLVDSNTAAVAVDDNTISGNMNIDNNGATTDASGNSVSGNLQCESNNTLTHGALNVVKGHNQGQCAASPG